MGIPLDLLGMVSGHLISLGLLCIGVGLWLGVRGDRIQKRRIGRLCIVGGLVLIVCVVAVWGFSQLLFEGTIRWPDP